MADKCLFVIILLDAAGNAQHRRSMAIMSRDDGIKQKDKNHHHHE
jgi:hypothetical protein